MNTFSPFRAGSVLVVLVMLLTGMIGRVAYLQTYGRQATIRSAERMHSQTVTLRSRPGNIFDCHGIMMAGSVQTQILYMDPKFMLECYQTDGRTLDDMDDDLNKLAKVIDKDRSFFSQLVADPERVNSRFVKVVENLDEQTVKRINELHIPGLGTIPMNVRNYPMGSIAAHVLGTRAKDGKGLEGLELKYDEVLTGKDGYARLLKDAKRRSIGLAEEDYCPPEHGKHLMLTIDANIQMIAEQELAAACEKNKAKRGEVVVMDPQTGDVLALANWPTFNPQNLEDSSMELRRDNALVSPFEPGSIIKPFIMSPAFAWHVTRPDEIWPLHGATWITPYGRPIKDVHGYPELCTWDVLVKSSNIGMSMLGNRMGNPRLHQALTGFGFGQPTGIELPGEDPGLLRPLRKWSRVSTESISQGYELMVTPIQLARAMSCIANGGRMVYPRIVKGELDPSGNLIAAKRPTPLGLELNVIDPITAAQMRRIMCDVPIRGTARGTRSLLWNLFGKTGTAHISNGKAGYSDSKYNSSYLGGAPYEDPKLVIAMLIHEPDKSIAHYGGAVSAPAANRALNRMLAYLQVPASPDLPLPPENLQKVIYSYNAKEYARNNAVMKDDEDPQD